MLGELLEKYVDIGHAQFQLPDVLKVPPLSEHGNVIEIAEHFGGPDSSCGRPSANSSNCSMRPRGDTWHDPTARQDADAAPTTAQRLGSIIKSCRDIMRKDKGLNGDLDRLPMLTWIMFLKFLDDMERVRGGSEASPEDATAQGDRAPYRWRDWNPPNSQGASSDGLHNAMTGDD